MCIACFERKKMDAEKLDKHDHAPFSPENLVPYHPFTKKYAQRQNLFDEGAAKVAKKVGGKKEVGGKPTKRKLDLGADAEAKKSKEDDGETDEEDDGVTLDDAVFKTAEVLELESDSSYKKLLKQSVNKRKQNAQDKQFKELREVIRSSAYAARQAYAIVAQAQTATPSVKDFLKVLKLAGSTR